MNNISMSIRKERSCSN